jgi:hypothetical protein
MKLIESYGSRPIGKDYLRYMGSVSLGKAQVSPFILIKKDTVECITHSRTLFEKAKDKDIILHAWPGKWKTDVFAYTFKELKELMVSCKVTKYAFDSDDWYSQF